MQRGETGVLVTHVLQLSPSGGLLHKDDVLLAVRCVYQCHFKSPQLAPTLPTLHSILPQRAASSPSFTLSCLNSPRSPYTHSLFFRPTALPHTSLSPALTRSSLSVALSRINSMLSLHYSATAHRCLTP